jgi:formamidopyrimidine-DNA glycosylase
MPEIPELEAIRGYFNEFASGKRIVEATTRIPVVFRSGAKALSAGLAGKTLGEVTRHGKFLLFAVEPGHVMAINPMLTGRFQFVPGETKLRAKTCLVLRLEGSERELRYSDERLMGKIYLLEAGQLSLIPNWDAGGPDLMDPSLDEDAWVERIKKYRGQIKGVLTKAEFVQGIGNAYADEILWEAKINPYRPRTRLSEEQLRELFRAARAVMTWATPLVRDSMVKDGVLDYEERRDFMHVHRLGGKPCPRCGHTISELTPNQRVTSFCRNCQPEN